VAASGLRDDGGVFAALWPAVGLPSAAELTELRAEVGALRDDLAEARLEAEEARAAELELPVGERQAGEALTAMWNGGWSPAAVPIERKRGEDVPN
jgi:outer membrane protein TolC